MDASEYRDAQAQCAFIASMALGLPDLDEMLRQIDVADATGPIIDPTLWMRGHARLRHVRELVVACRDLKAVAQQHLEESRPERESTSSVRERRQA